MRKVFLTFGDGAVNFIEARKRISSEARATGVFDEVLAYDWTNATQEAQNSILRNYKRGCGYWIWKPDVIMSVLNNLSDGDFLVWSDAGNILNKTDCQWRAFFDMLKDVDIIVRRISSCQFHRTRSELLLSREFTDNHMTNVLRMCYQFETGTAFIRKTDFTVGLIAEWRRFMLMHPECVCDVDSDLEKARQLPTFVENRHDQSVFTLLLYKYLSNPELCHRIKTVWEFHVGWNLLSDPCIYVARNRSAKEVYVTLRQRLIRLVYRLVWNLQLTLEKKGLCIFWCKGGYYG